MRKGDLVTNALKWQGRMQKLMTLIWQWQWNSSETGCTEIVATHEAFSTCVSDNGSFFPIMQRVLFACDEKSTMLSGTPSKSSLLCYKAWRWIRLENVTYGKRQSGIAAIKVVLKKQDYCQIPVSVRYKQVKSHQH